MASALALAMPLVLGNHGELQFFKGAPLCNFLREPLSEAHPLLYRMAFLMTCLLMSLGEDLLPTYELT